VVALEERPAAAVLSRRLPEHNLIPRRLPGVQQLRTLGLCDSISSSSSSSNRPQASRSVELEVDSRLRLEAALSASPDEWAAGGAGAEGVAPGVNGAAAAWPVVRGERVGRWGGCRAGCARCKGPQPAHLGTRPASAHPRALAWAPGGPQVFLETWGAAPRARGQASERRATWPCCLTRACWRWRRGGPRSGESVSEGGGCDAPLRLPLPSSQRSCLSDRRMRASRQVSSSPARCPNMASRSRA
jgi:hypothetical protein